VVSKIPYYFTNRKGGVSGITYGISSKTKERVVATSFKATNTIFQIVGQPWMDPTDSFFLAHVETLDDKFEILMDSQYAHSEQLFAQIPALVEEWKSLMFVTEYCTPALLSKRHQLSEIGTTIPQTSHKDRAFWVASLLNPVGVVQQTQQFNTQENAVKSICPDIRPTMLLCRNDYDRLVLALSALQTSIDFLKWYREYRTTGKL
jgi:hypothetical protein